MLPTLTVGRCCEQVFTDENGAPTDACAQIGGNNLPHRGGKCSIWEGGTKGISIVSSPLLTKTGFTYHGIAHAVDWLPTLVAGALGGSTASCKPLDGHNMWAALLSNEPSKSTRTDVYYGITDASVGIYGPALRTADGMKIIVGGWGGAKGQYKQLNDTYIDGTPALSYGEAAGGMMSTSTFHAEAALLSGAGVCTTNVTKGHCCPGDSFTSVRGVNDTATCCALCEKHKAQGCNSFTMNFDESTCWLKTKAACSYPGNCDCGHPAELPPAKGCPSGGHPANPPAHQPNSSKILLYNVEDDTGERVEMSQAKPDVVAKLHALVLAHQKTGIPQATPKTQGTTRCGPAVASQDNSTKGAGRMFWGPWC